MNAIVSGKGDLFGENLRQTVVFYLFVGFVAGYVDVCEGGKGRGGGGLCRGRGWRETPDCLPIAWMMVWKNIIFCCHLFP